MNYQKIEQLTPEWWDLKVGKISGTRYSQLISTRENSLLEEVVNELLDGYIQQDEFINDAMQFGTDNEPIAIDKYEIFSGMKFARGGVILSEYSKIHMASPDAVNLENGIIVEVKSTMKGATQIKRFLHGVETDKIGQIVNYFAVSDAVKEVHWVSYCPFRKERELVVIKFTRDTIISQKETKKNGIETVTVQDLVSIGREKLTELEKEIKQTIENFTNTF